MVKNIYELTFTSDIHKVKKIVTNILDFIKDQNQEIEIEALEDLRLIFHELLINAIVHGNQEDNNKNVMVKVTLKDDEIDAVVTDEGKGFDYEHVIEASDKQSSLFNERGRGIKIVGSLADSLNFSNNGSEINFCKKGVSRWIES